MGLLPMRFFRPSRGPRGLAFSAAITSLLLAPTLRAACDDVSPLHSCIQADEFWPHPGPSALLAVGGGELIEPGEMSFGLVTSYSYQPIRLRAPSPGGSIDVDVVKDLLTLGFAYSLGIAEGWELGAVLPFTVHQTGSGMAPYASSSFDPLPSMAPRDPRLGVAYALVSRDGGLHDGIAVAARLDATIPLGKKDAFASEIGPVLVPSMAADYRYGRWLVGAEAGMRVRTTSRFVTARMGPQALFALGVATEIWGEALGVGIQAFALPVLASQPSGKALVPAEWMAEFRTIPVSGSPWAISLGGGSALPLSGSAITAPALRAVLSVRYSLSTD